MQVQKREIAIELNLVPENLPILMKAVEQACLVFGMQAKDAMALTLASEEVFSYLCNHTDIKENIRMVCKNGIYYVQLDFIFPRSSLNLRAFNLSTDIDLDDDRQLEEMGLLIAARSVDRLYFNDEQQQSMILSLYKEKSYPPAEKSVSRLPQERNHFFLNKPDNEDLKSFCQLTSNLDTDALELPPFMHYPGKFVDMINSGEYQAALAFDQKQVVIGGIVWKAQVQKTVEIFGPYLFAQVDGMSEALIEYCLAQSGRSDAVGVISRCGIAEFSRQYFEELGSIRNYRTDGESLETTAYYRQLCEDLGQRIWTHPDLLPFLQMEYQRLFLPRDLRLVSNMGEQRHPHSVFSTELGYKQVILRPLLEGEDAAANLIKHLQLFAREKILNIFFEIDLGLAWHSELIPALLRQGFKPCLILPYAGKADLLLLQYQAGDAQ